MVMFRYLPCYSLLVVLNVYVQVPAPLLVGTECLCSGTCPAIIGTEYLLYVHVPAPLLDGPECCVQVPALVLVGTECLCSGTCPAIIGY